MPPRPRWVWTRARSGPKTRGEIFKCMLENAGCWPVFCVGSLRKCCAHSCYDWKSLSSALREENAAVSPDPLLLNQATTQDQLHLAYQLFMGICMRSYLLLPGWACGHPQTCTHVPVWRHVPLTATLAMGRPPALPLPSRGGSSQLWLPWPGPSQLPDLFIHSQRPASPSGVLPPPLQASPESMCGEGGTVPQSWGNWAQATAKVLNPGPTSAPSY